MSLSILSHHTIHANMKYEDSYCCGSPRPRTKRSLVYEVW